MLGSPTLTILLIRMLSPEEPRWMATFETLEKSLLADWHMYRYGTDHGATKWLLECEATASLTKHKTSTTSI
ncbi:hypothetical protein CA264_02465 [Pontibacter actiniarum]|uniref:Uncharacterized protein n=1 Tax=Pontibacter actiniarum TaxID=323450 RepID=A0A1X9YNG9_9BACT|nr:hypothetical protein CA264_02465 [Pontibacter actiniarum]